MDRTMQRDLDIFQRMDKEIQRIADEAMRAFMIGEPPPDRFWQPRVDVHETDDAVVVKIELAGVDSATLRVSLSGDDRYLTVSGERREDEAERSARIRCHRLEIYFGLFETRILLPPGIRFSRSGLRASYKDGMLTVLLPKRPGHRIAITAEQGKP